jgi:hypothetical protein
MNGFCSASTGAMGFAVAGEPTKVGDDVAGPGGMGAAWAAAGRRDAATAAAAAAMRAGVREDMGRPYTDCLRNVKLSKVSS